MIPVLIVGYLRPENMARILDLISPHRKTYIFIDHSSTNTSKNQEVLLTALKYTDTHLLEIRKMESNLGVGRAIPEAISWVFEEESSVIILEDDCIPNEFMFEYFDQNITLLDTKNVILSARAPQMSPEFVMHKNGTSSYPLTNAWAVKRNEWDKFMSSRNSKFPISEFLKGILISPRNILSLSYFFAATVRARNGLLKAWDVEMALYLLERGKKCLVPNNSCVTILGVDAVASNTRIKSESVSDLYQAASNLAPSTSWDFSKNFRREIDSQIEKNIYNLKAQHFFSPLKTMIILVLQAIHTKR